MAGRGAGWSAPLPAFFIFHLLCHRNYCHAAAAFAGLSASETLHKGVALKVLPDCLEQYSRSDAVDNDDLGEPRKGGVVEKGLKLRECFVNPHTNKIDS